jgi:hypothetical protein
MSNHTSISAPNTAGETTAPTCVGSTVTLLCVAEWWIFLWLAGEIGITEPDVFEPVHAEQSTIAIKPMGRSERVVACNETAMEHLLDKIKCLVEVNAAFAVT